ncbi:hypothetical protein [Myroides pelagicus]|uniref:DUF4131 domain-containing protein n=1 Tax=Myroides pelagicus TaxID=270914 RepID=A0A7K1GID5_9FLAO|nr:hypothetical protein [Myroides pelagicus]MEC4112552.1 hypothetical protein [Myroides pelagicus]MTH28530.1 hypothetical protein [Myroides pelagicus]
MKVLKFSFLFYAIFLCVGIILQSYVAFVFSIVVLVISLCFLWITSWKAYKVRAVRLNAILYGGSISLIFFCLGHLSMSFQVFKKSLIDLSHTNESSLVFVIEQNLPSSTVNNNRYIARIINVDDQIINKPLLVNYFNKNGEELAVARTYYSKSTPRVLNSSKIKEVLIIKGICM